MFAYEIDLGDVLGRVGAHIGWEYTHSTPKHLLTFGCVCGRVWARGGGYGTVWGYMPTQEFREHDKGAHAFLARAPHIKERY